MEVLYLELLDALAQNSVHLTHVDEFVVDFVDVAIIPLSFWGIRLLGLLHAVGCICAVVRVFQEPSVLRVAHLNLIFDLRRQHVLKLIGVSLENALNELESLS